MLHYRTAPLATARSLRERHCQDNYPNRKRFDPDAAPAIRRAVSDDFPL
jgi:hypothetical protein